MVVLIWKPQPEVILFNHRRLYGCSSPSSSSSCSIRGSPQRRAGICRTQAGREGTWPGQGSQRGPGAAAGWSRAAYRQQWQWVWHQRRRLLGASAWREKTSSRSAGRHDHITVKGLLHQPPHAFFYNPISLSWDFYFYYYRSTAEDIYIYIYILTTQWDVDVWWCINSRRQQWCKWCRIILRIPESWRMKSSQVHFHLRSHHTLQCRKKKKLD